MQARARRDLGLDRRQDVGGGELADRCDPELGARGDEAAEEARVLRVGGHDLVTRTDSQAAQDDVAPLGRRAGERDLLGLRRQQARELGAERLALGEHALEVRPARPTLLQLSALDRLHRLDGRARQRAERARVQVGVALQHGKPARTATRSMRSSPPPGRGRRAGRRRRVRRSSGQTSGPRSSWAPRTRIWSMPSIGAVKPGTGRRRTLKSPQRMQRSASARKAAARSISCSMSSWSGVLDACRLASTTRSRLNVDLERVADAPLSAAYEPVRRERPGLRTARRWRPTSKCGLTRSTLACPVRLERKRTGSADGHSTRERPQERRHGHRPGRAHPAPVVEVLHRPERHLLQRDDVRRVGGDETHHLLEVERCRTAGASFRGRGSSC